MDLLKFTVLDDTSHIIGPGEYTVCGIIIPPDGTWTTDQPKKVCPDCKARAKGSDEFGVSETADEPAPIATKPTGKAASGSKA